MKTTWPFAAAALALAGALAACAVQKTALSTASPSGAEKSGVLKVGEPAVLSRSGRETIVKAGLTAHGKIEPWQAGTKRSIDFSREEIAYLGLQADGKARVEYRVFRGPQGQLAESQDVDFDAKGGSASVNRYLVELGPASENSVPYRAVAK